MDEGGGGMMTIPKPKTHVINESGPDFEAVWCGNKRFQIRTVDDNRSFNVCDFLLIIETSPVGRELGRSVLAEITYIVKGTDFGGIVDDLAVLSINRLVQYGPGYSHHHSCPECYKKYDCADDCTIVDFVDGIPIGLGRACASCSPGRATAESKENVGVDKGDVKTALSLEQLTEIESGIAQFRVALREMGDSNLGAANEELLTLQQLLVDEVKRLREEAERSRRTWEWRPMSIDKSAWMLVSQSEPSELVARIKFDGAYYNWDVAGDDGSVLFSDGGLAEAMRRAEEAASEIRPIDTIIRPEMGK